MSLITRETAASLLPLRPKDANKGSFGRVLVVAGSRTMCGAGFLCAKSALLSGAGMVFWALPQSMQPAFAAALPEVITLPLPEDERGELHSSGAAVLQRFCEERKPSVAVLGPGMGKSALIGHFLNQSGELPLVLDADALNFLAQQEGWQKPDAQPVIFTPHPGEMARLLKTDMASGEAERLRQAQELCRLTRGVSILKGSGTLVCGQSNGSIQTWQNTTGGPGLAKAGSGDVLSGVIAGLWAQLGTAGKFDADTALKAALCGVYVHGLAGDLAAREHTAYGVLAQDTAACVPLAIKELLETSAGKESV